MGGQMNHSRSYQVGRSCGEIRGTYHHRFTEVRKYTTFLLEQQQNVDKRIKFIISKYLHKWEKRPEKSRSFRCSGYMHEMNKQECEGSKSAGRFCPAI